MASSKKSENTVGTVAIFMIRRQVMRPVRGDQANPGNGEGTNEKPNSIHKRRIKEMRKNLLVAVVLSVTLLFTGLILAQKPDRNVSGKRHPNIAAAQRLSSQAYQRIVDAQNANEWDLAGHAQKAKQLLEEANDELKKSAEISNINHRPDK